MELFLLVNSIHLIKYIESKEFLSPLPPMVLKILTILLN